MNGKDLRTLRRKLGVNQRQLCTRAGIKWMVLSAIEKGIVVTEKPSCEDLARLCFDIAGVKLSQAATAFDASTTTAQAE
jgi:transcriptional regulator with XRE-family HTH domain